MNGLRPGGRRLQAAVIGLGVSGSWTIEAFAALGGITCVAGVDRQGNEAPGSNLIGGPTLRTVEQLAEYGQLDLVVIATATASHAELALRVLELDPARLWIEKPRVTTAAQLAELWAQRPGTEVRTLMHRFYGEDIPYVRCELDGWCGEHGPIAAIDQIFFDPYMASPAECATLGDCWLDSGINALSAAAALVQVGECQAVTGELPSAATATLTFSHSGHSGPLTVRTAWLEGQAQKLTTMRFADGAVLAIDHRSASITMTAGGDRILHEQLTPNLGAPRYARMFASYLANDENAPTPALDRHLHELLIQAHARLTAARSS